MTRQDLADLQVRVDGVNQKLSHIIDKMQAVEIEDSETYVPGVSDLSDSPTPSTVDDGDIEDWVTDLDEVLEEINNIRSQLVDQL